MQRPDILHSDNFVYFSGNIAGYHVVSPCFQCLEACNNGHFWMFHSEFCQPSERTDDSGAYLKKKTCYYEPNTCILIDSMTQGATHCFGQVYPELKWMQIFSLGIPFDTKPCAVNSCGIGCALKIVDDICLAGRTDQWKQTKMDDPPTEKKNWTQKTQLY